MIQCVLKHPCPRKIWQYCLMCNELKTAHLDADTIAGLIVKHEKGKQMIEVNEGDRIAVEMTVTRRNGSKVEAEFISGLGLLKVIVPQASIREIIEHGKPKPGDIIGWSRVTVCLCVIAVDDDVVFGRFVNNESSGWGYIELDGKTHGCQTLEGYRVMERAKS